MQKGAIASQVHLRLALPCILFMLMSSLEKRTTEASCASSLSAFLRSVMSLIAATLTSFPLYRMFLPRDSTGKVEPSFRRTVNSNGVSYPFLIFCFAIW